MEGLNRQNCFEYITVEETNYQTLPVEVAEGYEWNMANHLKLSSLYKMSQYETGNSDDKPFMNIMRPILNLHYRAEGFDVKDIVLFVNSAKDYFKSFLIKKYHEKWARENEIDTFIDEMVESYVDFGGALLKNVNKKRPEVVPLQRLAFCDQTDILSGPICEKHFYAPDELKEMEKKGWENVDDLIALSESAKYTEQANRQIKTPGKYIKIYELHGMFPDWWMNDDPEYVDDDTKYTRQMHVVGFYQVDDKENKAITLYKGLEKEGMYKFISRDKIFGRALGFGGAEELFEAQVWTNYSAIQIKEMLDAASKVIFQTTDTGFGKRNKLKHLSNMEVLDVADGKRVDQINTTPVNLKLFENSIIKWEENAQATGEAYEPTMGREPTAGTPFSSLELQVSQGLSGHKYRRGKLATFLDTVWRDWVIPHIVKDINQGQEFLSECDLDELQGIVENVVTNQSNKMIKEKILRGEKTVKAEIEEEKQKTRDGFMKDGKKFIKLIKDELKDAPLDVHTNIAGKQKDLVKVTEGLNRVFNQMLSTYDPQTKTFAIFDDPRMTKVFNQILEASSLSPVNFYQSPQQQQLQQQQLAQQQAQQPEQNLAQITK